MKLWPPRDYRTHLVVFPPNSILHKLESKINHWKRLQSQMSFSPPTQKSRELTTRTLRSTRTRLLDLTRRIQVTHIQVASTLPNTLHTLFTDQVRRSSTRSWGMDHRVTSLSIAQPISLQKASPWRRDSCTVRSSMWQRTRQTQGKSNPATARDSSHILASKDSIDLWSLAPSQHRQFPLSHNHSTWLMNSSHIPWLGTDLIIKTWRSMRSRLM